MMQGESIFARPAVYGLGFRKKEEQQKSLVSLLSLEEEEIEAVSPPHVLYSLPLGK